MSKRIKFSRLLISIIFLFCQYITLAQKVVSIEFQINPGYSTVDAKMPSNLTQSSSNGSFNLDLGILARYYLDKRQGICSGILLKTYKTSFSGKEYHVSFDAIDSENEPYVRNVDGVDIAETSTLRCINIPIHYFYSYPLSRSVSFVGKIGPGISIPIQKDCRGSGTFTYTGRYPQYSNVILADIPPYGFNSDVPVNVNEKLKTNLFIVDAAVSAGFIFSMNRYWKFYTDINYSRTITRIVKKENGAYHVSDDLGSYYSFINSGNTAANSFFITIGLQKWFLF